MTYPTNRRGELQTDNRFVSMPTTGASDDMRKCQSAYVEPTQQNKANGDDEGGN